MVEKVRVACPAPLPEMVTGLVEPKLIVGGSVTPVGLEVIAAVSVTLPVKPPEGVTVMVLFTGVPADTARVEGAAEIVKLCTGTAVTVSEIKVDAVRLPELPVIVTGDVPVVAELLAVSVSTLEPVVGLVAKPAVTPLGRPEAASVTAPLNPPAPATEMVLVPLLP